MNPLYQGDYRAKGGKPGGLEHVDDTGRHTRNMMAKQDKRLAKGIRALIGVLISMGGRATYEGRTHIEPGMDELAKRTGCTARTARTHCRSLEAWGFLVPLESRKGQGARQMYRLDFYALVRAFQAMKYRLSGLLIGKLRDMMDAKVLHKKRPKSTRTARKITTEVCPEIFGSPYIEDINTVRSAPSERTGGEASHKPSTPPNAVKSLFASLSAQYDRLRDLIGPEYPTRQTRNDEDRRFNSPFSGWAGAEVKQSRTSNYSFAGAE